MTEEKDSFSLSNISAQYNSNYQGCSSIATYVMYKSYKRSNLEVLKVEFRQKHSNLRGHLENKWVKHANPWLCMKFAVSIMRWHPFAPDNGLCLRENKLVPCICSL